MAEAKSPGKGRGGDRGSLPGRKGNEDDDDEEEDDARIIHAGSPVAPTASGSTSVAAQKREKIAAAHGLALDLGSKGMADSCLREDRISTQLESAVTVVFELPDGSTWEEEFKLGHTVEMLKGYAEREFGISMSEQQLYYDGSVMLDPLSLADYVGGSTTRVLEVRVEGEMEDDAKK